MSLDVYLDREPCEHCGADWARLFSKNITHNLSSLAGAVGLYIPLWHPERLRAVLRAADLVPLLEFGLQALSDPLRREELKKLEPENGWGDFEYLVTFVTEYLEACRRFPKALVEVSR